jgi:hypothetical protein
MSFFEANLQLFLANFYWHLYKSSLNPPKMEFVVSIKFSRLSNLSLYYCWFLGIIVGRWI